MRSTLLAGMVIASAACRGTPAPDAAPDLRCLPIPGNTVALREVARTVDVALLATSPPGDPRLFILQRTGVIEIVESGALQMTFLDVNESISVATSEQGLLGLAFHPAYASNRRFFIFYTTNTENIVAEYAARADDPNLGTSPHGYGIRWWEQRPALSASSCSWST